MHIIFGQINRWAVPLLKILRFFKLKVFYLYVVANSVSEKNKIANKLRESKIIPLPLEFEKEFSQKAGFFEIDSDLNENSYKKNIKLVPDEIINKYCKLFSVNKKNNKKIRLLIQDFICKYHIHISGYINMWAAIYKSKRIIYISFNFLCFYTSDSDTSKNISKIIIPLNILNYLVKIIKFFLLTLVPIKRKEGSHKNNNFNVLNFQELEKKSVAFIPHKGIIYGTKEHIIFEKTLYYTNDKNSRFNKYNILHLDYDNFPSPEKNISWVCLGKIKVSQLKIFFKILSAFIKTFYLIRSWNLFLGWLLCIQQYITYLKYCEIIKKFKNLKIAIIDYDVLCPKTLILALEKNNVKTVATQERFFHAFYTSYANVIIDTYFVGSDFIADFIKKSKYYEVKNIIVVGQYRSDLIELYKNKIIPDEICKEKKNGKKILVALGFHSPNNWFESYLHPITNWTAQINFLEDIIKLSRHLNNTFIILRYKTLDWTNNKYFEKILQKLGTCKNIFLSNNYKEPNYSYKLCSNADLVIGKIASLIDECLVQGIPALYHEYNHNMKKITSVALDYPHPSLACYNFEELYQKSKSLLFNNSSKLKDEIATLNKTIYYVREKGNIKSKIIGQLENLINENKF